MKNYFILLLIFGIYSCKESPKIINVTSLKTELDSILILDQKYRSEIETVYEKYGENSPEFKTILNQQNKIDSTNLIRIIEIIEDIKQYPGVSLVGYGASKTAFFVLQHAPDSIQIKYYELIVNAAKNNELDRGLAAMYQDRYLMYQGKPQIYGTQIRVKHKVDSLTGLPLDSTYLWPIKDITKIDSIRMWNGLGPLENYLNSFGLSRKIKTS